MLANAVRICEAKFGVLYRLDDGLFHAAALHGVPSAYAEYLQQLGWFRPVGKGSLHDLLRAKNVVHTADRLEESDPGPAAKYGGARSMITVPMFKDRELIGAILIYRQEVRPFGEKQIELVTSFASQAVIAIENARLFQAEQTRTRELTERTQELTDTLEYQTATSDVLGIISRSPNELQPVFDSIVETAQRLCEAYDASIVLTDGERLKLKAHVGPIPMRAEWPLGNRGLVVSRSVMDKKTVHVHDLAAGEGEFPEGREDALKSGHRSILAAPLVHKGEGIGALIVRRFEVHPFSDRQIALLATFADQAVIAIENTRLFEEVRTRTRELTEALEQQTATSEVLQIISSSPGELKPVFEAILENAVRICDAKFGTLYLCEANAFRAVAMHNTPPSFAEERRGLLHPGPDTSLSRAARTKQAAQIVDIADAPGYRVGERFGVSSAL
jgi:two-component system, NtrC family, sensor kinase